MTEQKLKILICDDEPVILQKLKALTEDTFQDGWEADIICTDSPQQLMSLAADVSIAVLDIQLPEQTGIDLAAQILQKNPDCRIIFVSGYVRYVSDVYDVPHFCMVLKEQMDVQLPKFLLRVAQQITKWEAETLTLCSNGSSQTIDMKLVYYLERRGHTTYMKLRNGQYLKTREKLGDIVGKATNGSLCRCHISYAVNLQWIRSMGKSDFTMQGGERIPISRSNKQLARDAYFRYLREML